ncbi:MULTISPECIES: MarR family winged helix-turn-helix transcriptional regulator [Glaesserella]|uniref:MarR family transcriptional regulator n=1 Tax=Glaesserella australis TaxID=2094024 RepID=A0A328BZW7_9PAST|nr:MULTISPECIES: MarR family winged helix-turn-helix transcriptional regulator [Glaesserella]AUI65310.1 MarR family transcriptional regulator [Glaesserella sp. 15-184]RAL18582.1 MarR family transcriptional regulator [Glaesserella australis]
MNHFDELGNCISEMDNALNHWISKLGLNYNHFAVLYALAQTVKNGCTQKQICEDWYLPKQTVFNICKEYKEKGWIEFAESANDKREKIMHLTESGKTQAEPIFHATRSVSELAFAEFGDEKIVQLFTLMREFSATFNQKIDEYEHDKS